MDQLDPQLNDSAILLRTLLNSVPFGIIVLDSQGIVKHGNQQAIDFLAISIQYEKYLGSSLIKILDHLKPFAEELNNYLIEPETSKSFESIICHNRSLDISIHLIQDGFLMIINDITKLKEMEANSILSIVASQENQRRRLARDIHDGIGPLLSSAKLELDLFLEDLNELDTHIPDARLYRIRQTIDSISADLRDLSHRLIPRLLEEFGLFSAFQNLVSRTQDSTKSHIDFYCNIDPEERFHNDIELNLFRCGQELLNNAVKHAQAKKIILQLIRHNESINLMVEDDGIGFDPSEMKSISDGIGLTNIESRARSLNGEIIIETEKGRGSLFSVEFPI